MNIKNQKTPHKSAVSFGSFSLGKQRKERTQRIHTSMISKSIYK